MVSRLKSWTDFEREAIVHALNMMKIFSNDKDISSQLNNSDIEGFDRESVIFRLLTERDSACTEDVKLAAAETLRGVVLSQLDKGEIRKVVNMLSSVPALVSEKTYDILTNLVFLVFKMAMVKLEFWLNWGGMV